jgi:hypothetical protein
MKSLEDFKNILLEEEKSDYSKFDMLVRAGLANKAQIQRIHKILDKMGEEKPNFSPADRMIVQNLFNKMVDLISNNKQIFQQTRRAVREDIVDTSDYKIDKTGRKYKAHRIKLGDTTPAVADGTVELAKEEVLELNERIDPPFVLVLKRKAIRIYPEGTKIALYYNERLKKYFSIPYSDEAGLDSPIQAEEIKEAVDAMGQLQKIKDSHSHGTVNHKDGSASKVDVQTAHAVLMVHKSLNDENKIKFADMVARSSHHMQKAANFAVNKMK